MLEVCRALGKGGTGGSEEVALVREQGGLDVLEDIALGENLGTGLVIESVAGVLSPEVVDGMEKGVSTKLGAAAAGVVDVVALQGDEIVCTNGQECPTRSKSVYVSIASSMWKTYQ